MISVYSKKPLFSQIDETEVLWDEKVNKIEISSGEKKVINPYSPHQDLHWSQLAEINDRKVIELSHCNNFETFHQGSQFFAEEDLGEIFEDKIRYQIEKCDVFSVS